MRISIASIGIRVTGGLLVLAAILAFMGGLSYYHLGSIEELVSTQVMETSNARHLSKSIIFENEQTAALVKEYILTEKKGRKLGIRIVINDVLQTTQEYMRQVSNRKLTFTENEMFEKIRAVHTQYLETLKTLLESYKTEGKPQRETIRAAKDFHDLHAHLITLLLQFDKLETDMMYSSWGFFKDKVRLIKTAILLFNAIALLFAVALGIILSRSITRPISQLVRVLEQYGSGDFSVRARVNSRDEIGYFANRFNVMLEQLQGAHQRLSDTVDFLPDATFVVDSEKKVIAWNKAIEEMTGVPARDIIDKGDQAYSLPFYGEKRPILIDFVFNEEPDLQKKYTSFEKKEHTLYAETYVPYLHKGKGAYLWGTASPLFDKLGNRVGAIESLRDITGRKQAEEDHRKLENQLIQAQKMEAIGTLAGGIAHDFNNILSGIMGYSELCLKAVQDRPKVHHHMEQVIKATERAKDLVQQILTFSRKAEQEKKPTALSPIIKEVVNFMRASLPTTIEITPKIEETADVIMADPTQMHQVLINLCTNAGHAMKGTGGVLEIGLEEVVINATDLLQRPPIRHGHYLVLTVRDTGQGIPQENLVRIFEPYFTTKEKGAGTGLGLAVVHGIVKDHCGEVRVYSEVGKGTTFRVYLPLMEKQTEGGKDMEEALLPGKGETILFIDDEKMVVDLSRELLEGLGYRVVAETDPAKAIEIFKEGSDAFDIVITDKTMPHLTGFDVAWEIRRIRTDIPIVLCSGFQEKEDLKKLKILGISQLIIKPTRMSALAKTIREVLDKDKLEIFKT